jgi:hypothetical protein
MTTISRADAPAHPLPRGLCLLVVLIVVLAVVYTAWIAIGNFSRIGV